MNVLLVLNAICGIAMLEWAWHKTRRYRFPIDELNAQFPELIRHDAKWWRKWKLYPGAATLMIPRMIFAFICASLIAIFLTIFMLGHNRDSPMNAVRRFLCRATVRIGCFFFCLAWFTLPTWRRISQQEVGFYEEYLGPIADQRRYHSAENTEVHPKVPQRGTGPSSTIVCNHTGWMEIIT